MGILQKIDAWFEGSAEREAKSNIVTTTVPRASDAAIEQAIIEGQTRETAFAVSAVLACARVIAEGLALPPCYLHRRDGTGRKEALDHPLHYLLHGSPNDRQTSYEFREQLGYHLALDGNAYVWVNRSPRTGEILELLPCDHGSVTVFVDESRLGAPVSYYLYGRQIPTSQMWHLKGPAVRSWQGMSTLQNARNAIGLARATELFGSNLFKNGARPGGLIAPADGITLTADQAHEIRAMWAAQATGVGNAHKTILLTSGLKYSPMANTANDSQWVETRRYEIEEICRYFRVSPTKVFQQLGSQSYASVEQAHIAHDQDTDAHWHERFVQSANKALLTVAERREGYDVSIDNRAALRGTATERMTYYTAAVAAGIMTRNEARDLEGFDRSDDPSADNLTPAANLFGPAPAKTPPAK